MESEINFDAVTGKGNPGISTCAIVIKEDRLTEHYAIHELGEMDNHTAEWGRMYLCTRNMHVN